MTAFKQFVTVFLWLFSLLIGSCLCLNRQERLLVKLLESKSIQDPLTSVKSAKAFAHYSAPTSALMSSSPAFTQGEIQSSDSKDVKPVRAFEIDRPTRILPDQDGVRSCSLVLLEHSFGNSYGQPAITEYSPDLFSDPACKDPTNWVFIQLDIQGTGKGRQFDRLGSIQLDSVEVLRTDNQEPSVNGSIWNFSKEMNKYYDLFQTKRTLLFDMPNIVNDIYVSPLNYTVTLTAYIANDAQCKLKPLSNSYPVILPLSEGTTDSNAFFELGDELNGSSGVSKLKVPHNAKTALVEIYASGTAQDEFWYTNVPNKEYEELGGASSGIAYPRGPLRELQILIDGRLAGIAQPYPVVFTGGISPFFWRPQVSYGAFSQPTYTIDITPFLGTLTDDQEHEFTLKVVSAEKNQTVLAWFISGNIQIELDSSNERTTGNITQYIAPLAGTYEDISTINGNVTENGTASIDLQTPPGQSRTILIEGIVKPGSNPDGYPVKWEQSITYSNKNFLSSNSSSTLQEAQGSSSSQHGTEIIFAQTFSFPFNLTNQGVNYTLEHGYHVSTTYGSSAVDTFKEPQSQKVDMTQNGIAVSIVSGNPPQLVGGYGESFESYAYEDSNGLTFYRDNSVYNQTLTNDEVRGTLASEAGPV